MMKVKTCVGVVLSLYMVASTSQAFVDPTNQLAPSLAAQGQSIQIVVRKANGTIWAKNLQPVQSIWFSTPGSPPNGASTGPQVVFVGHTGTPWWLARATGDDRIWVNRGLGSWESPIFGRPTGVTLSSTAFGAYADENNGVVVVSLDTANRPWFKKVSETGAVIQDWTRFNATDPVVAPPGVAMNFSTGKISAFGTLDVGNLRVTTCGFPFCFTSWDLLPGNGFSNSGLTGASFLAPGGNVFTTAALLGTDNRVYWTQDISGAGYDGWHQRGTATADSQPAACYFGMGFANEPALAVHRSDGNYYFSLHGTTWSNIGHP
jgi:hypothetical protein